MPSFFRAGALAAGLLTASVSTAMAQTIDRVDPTNWFVGMKNPDLQLLVHGAGIGTSKAELAAPYPGVTLVSAERADNPNYLYISLRVGPEAKPGQVKLRFLGTGRKVKNLDYSYELKARPTEAKRIQGVTSADFVYLLMPDRFANGDPANDVVKTTRVNHIARDTSTARHGGDLKGIIDHFPYLKELGVTAIWPTPVVENDQPKESYHGYAVTDYYRVDPRYGSNQQYIDFVRQAHQQGLKVIHDVVLNHMGAENYLFRDAPAADWFHQWPAFTRSNFRDAAFNDPYKSQYDYLRFNNGWFDNHMPDLNQSNPHVATYLTQNFIWWVETAGFDGYRVDTYSYSEPKFLMQWTSAILDQYPQLGMFAETWVQGTAQQAYFARNILPPVDGFKSTMPGVTDFQLYYAINDALNQNPGWTEGISKLYYTLQADYLYENPLRNVVFLDNHDLSRFYSTVGEDFAKYKMGLAWLLTVRGTPQLYYGTEVLLKSSKTSGHGGEVREDFPGGWASDKRNLFTAAGRSVKEQEAFQFVSGLAQYRKTHPVLQTGKLMQFIPEDGVYTYFRYKDGGACVMVMMNPNKDPKTVKTERFAERLSGFKAGKEITTGATIADLSTLTIPARTAWVVELQ